MRNFSYSDSSSPSDVEATISAETVEALEGFFFCPCPTARLGRFDDDDDDDDDDD